MVVEGKEGGTSRSAACRLVGWDRADRGTTAWDNGRWTDRVGLRNGSVLSVRITEETRTVAFEGNILSLM